MPAPVQRPMLPFSRGIFRSRQHGRAPPKLLTLADIVPRGTPIYLLRRADDQARTRSSRRRRALRKAGSSPSFTSRRGGLRVPRLLQELLSGLRGEADVRRLLLIGGDVDAPGAFSDALAVIQKGRPARGRHRGDRHRRLPGRSSAYSGWAAGIRTRRENCRCNCTRPTRPYCQPVLVFARTDSGLAQTGARGRHRSADKNRHGGANQRACAASLRQTLRRGRIIARAGLGRRQRPYWSCRAGPHHRELIGG